MNAKILEKIKNDPFVLNTTRAMERGPPAVCSAKLPHPIWSRQFYLAGKRHHEQERAAANGGKDELQIISQTMIPFLEHGVAKELGSLRKIVLSTIAEKVNSIHVGRVLYCVTICEPYRVIGTNTFVQDDQGDCVQVGLYNKVARFEQPETVLPQGTYLALMEPYMRHSQDDPDAPLMLRCDNPQCVVLFESKEAWNAAKSNKVGPNPRGSPPSLRQKGNESFRKGNYQQALSLYSGALLHPGITDEDKIACLSNRAEVHLRRECWEAAQDDARKVLAMDSSHIKAKYRLAKALLHLDCIVKGRDLLLELRNTKAADKWLLREAERLVEESIGKFNLTSMRKHRNEDQLHADYVSGAIDLGVSVSRPSVGSYRGSVAKEDVPVRTIVCSSKALSFVPEKDLSCNSWQSSPYTKQMQKGSTVALSNEIVQLLHRRPQLGNRLYSLHSGETKPTDHNSHNLIDIGRIRDILSNNTFSVFREHTDLLCDWERMQKEERRGGLMTEAEQEDFSNQLMRTEGAGLWIHESLFNHSCTPNCTWFQIGRQMFIQTVRPVSAGEELCITYIPCDMPYTQRTEKFHNWIRPGYGFVCACNYCDTLRSRPTLQAMETEVHKAFQEASRLVSATGMKMADAADRVMSQSRRREILYAFSALPPSLQHTPIVMLETMQGSVLQREGKQKDALQCYQKASEIEYEISGESYKYAKTLWRLVGASVANDRPQQATEYLQVIHNLSCFQALTNKLERKVAFTQLTLRYSMPWIEDNYSEMHHQQLMVLTKRVSEQH